MLISLSTDVCGHYTPLQCGHCLESRAARGLPMTTASFSLDHKVTTSLIGMEILL